MPSPHWENLKEIFNGAVALPSGERAAYLDKECDGDLSLREAVESWLKSHEETGFVDHPAYQAAAEMLGNDAGFKSGQLWPTTEFFRCSAKAAWARFIWRRTRNSIGK